MKIKTKNLIGAALDWAVAKCRGLDQGFLPFGDTILLLRANGDHTSSQYSKEWFQSGCIIESERICLTIGHDGVWLAFTMQNYEDRREYIHAGPTPLIAAMRCYVAFTLGEEVDIPDELSPPPGG